MEGGIRVPGSDDGPTAGNRVRLIPMQVGTAIVYVEQMGEPEVVSDGQGGIRPVAAPDLSEAFQRAGDAIYECVRSVGERVESLADSRPDEVTVEFSLTFEAQGGVHLLPLFVTAQSKVGTGIKVTATWTRSEGQQRP